MGVGELRDFISQKVTHLDELPVDIDYIHVRGMGEEPRKRISELKEELDEENAKQVSDINRKENGPNELVLAIDISSIS